jgi:hypothetical protein
MNGATGSQGTYGFTGATGSQGSTGDVNKLMFVSQITAESYPSNYLLFANSVNKSFFVRLKNGQTFCTVFFDFNNK